MRLDVQSGIVTVSHRLRSLLTLPSLRRLRRPIFDTVMHAIFLAIALMGLAGFATHAVPLLSANVIHSLGGKSDDIDAHIDPGRCPEFLTGLAANPCALQTAAGEARPAGIWYVHASGSDANNCATALSACASVNGVLGKGGFTDGDAVLVAAGTYVGTGSQVVLLNRSATLSGGWDSAFVSQIGLAVFDGQNQRKGMQVPSGVSATLARIAVVRAYVQTCPCGAGIVNSGALTISRSMISENYTVGEGGGLWNDGVVRLFESSVSNNAAGTGFFSSQGGGIYNTGVLELNNTTVSGNIADNGGGILNTGSLTLSNVTINNNTAYMGGIDPIGGGGIRQIGASFTIRNSILAGNHASTSPECSGGLASDGYNIISDVSGCTYTFAGGDQIGIKARTGALEGLPPFHPLLAGSPAIDAASPGGCMGSLGLLRQDQRGYLRVGRCDIGAVEMQPIEYSAKTIAHPFVEPGGVLTYTVALRNPGVWDLTGVIMTDSVPAGTSYISGTLTSNQGNALQSDTVLTWTGTLSANSQADISFAVILSPTLSGSLTNTASIISNGTVVQRTAVATVGYAAYLPAIMRDFCGSFFDDFSNPLSGWPVGESSLVQLAYLSGEYRVLSKSAGYFFLSKAPDCLHYSYSVDADARWNGTPGNSYGLVFGITNGFDQYYLFDMNTVVQQFRLLRRDSGGGFSTIVPPTFSDAIHVASASNHLKATRDPVLNTIMLEVNGVVLGSWVDSAVTGLTGTGVVSSASSGNPNADARFDNFRVNPFSSGDSIGAGLSPNAPSRVPSSASGTRVDTISSGIPEWR